MGFEKGWTPVSNLKVGDVILEIDRENIKKGTFCYNGKVIHRIAKVEKPLTVYNITTETGTYFVEGI